MKTGRTAISCFLIGLFLLPLDAHSQTKRSDWTAVMAVRSGSRLVVESRTALPVEGKLLSVDDTGLTLSAGGRDVAIPKAEVRRVYKVERGLSKKAVLTGTAIGAAIGAGLGVAGGGECRGGIGPCFPRSQTVPAVAAVGAVFGLLTGALAGGLRHGRKLIFEAN